MAVLGWARAWRASWIPKLTDEDLPAQRARRREKRPDPDLVGDNATNAEKYRFLLQFTGQAA